MGLDNSFNIVNIKCEEIPFWVKLPWGRDNKDEAQDIVYFRKCWGIRNEILGLLHSSDQEYEIPVEKDDLLPIVKILMKYLNKAYYDENADSIWEFEEAYDNIRQSIINLIWLKTYMDKHSDVMCHFYDSY